MENAVDYEKMIKCYTLNVYKNIKLFNNKLNVMLTIVMHYYFRFDTELHSLQEDLKNEKAQREKIAREKDMAMSDKFSLEQTLSVSISRNTHR